MPSFLVSIYEFNHCHNPGGSAGGQFCSDGGGVASGRPTPVKAKNLEDAVTLVLAGKVVEVSDVRAVNTLLAKLAAMALDAKAKGQAAPTYNLCNVSVAGTNLFCGGHFTSERYPTGVPRIKMPQLKAEPVPGSVADRLPRAPGKTTVDAAEAFVAHLSREGIRVGAVEHVPAAALKATQRELVGPTVARMMTDPKYDPAKEPIFISRDNYVLDGHHRWAAVVGRDAADNKLGDLTMRAIRVDAPISELLKVAKKWTKAVGLQGRGTEAH